MSPWWPILIGADDLIDCFGCGYVNDDDDDDDLI